MTIDWSHFTPWHSLAVVALGAGHWQALVFVLAMLAGRAVQGRWHWPPAADGAARQGHG